MKAAVVAGLLLISIASINAATDKVVCIFNNDAAYRVGAGKRTIEDINANLCTHVIYNSITLTNTGTLQLLDSYNDVTKGGFTQLQSLRQRYPGVKFMIGLGGPSTSSKTFSRVVSELALRQAAVGTIINFLTQKYQFDGLDFYWQYPVLKGGNPEDRSNFVSFIMELSANMRMHGLVLTLTVAPTNDFFMSSYDVPNLARYVDFLHITAFNLHGFWDAKTGHQSALYASGREGSDHEAQLNVDAIVSGWISAGAPPSKLILGLTANAVTFKLYNANDNGVGARTVGRGEPGPYTTTEGSMSYHELCLAKSQGGWTTILDRAQQGYYAHKGPLWVSYDDTPAVLLKASYIISRGLAGIALFNAESDDAGNQCGQGTYPLLRSVNEGLKRTVPDVSSGTTTTTTTTVKPTTTPTTTTTKKPTTTTTKPPQENPRICPKSGYVRDPNNCSVYYRCIPNGIFLTTWKFTCPTGLMFNEAISACDYPGRVKC
uniref:Chitinase n=1 Tax=Anopheles atroparvus TaxID=41427 RepID=A0AAG5DLM8_ANOAO